MEYIRDKQTNIPFSLHDSRILNIRYEDKSLILEIDKIFEYTKEGEKTYLAEIIFTDVDLEECSLWIFDTIVYEGSFKGKAVSIKDYISDFSKTEFEILTEAYNGYSTIFIGWIWQKDKEPFTGIFNIWTMGEMIYKIGKEI